MTGKEGANWAAARAPALALKCLISGPEYSHFCYTIVRIQSLIVEKFTVKTVAPS
jgi:hypothetical protein